MKFKKKKMKLLPNEQQKSHENGKFCYICKEKFEGKYGKVRNHYHYTGKHKGAAHSICNLKYSTPKEISIIFYNGFNYDYYFIIKRLAGEFERQFACLGEDTEKTQPFQFQQKKR